MSRRKRQFWLFLVAVVLPAASLSVVTFRFLRQDEELARQREPEQRREAVEQARRELARVLRQSVFKKSTAASPPSNLHPRPARRIPQLSL